MQHFFKARLSHKKILSALSLSVFAISLLSSTANAAGLIRDSEIEHTLRSYSEPIFQRAGLTPSSISLYIVNDPSINAFVMGGSNIFINTGLLMQSETPEMVIGVIAHETGHIAGGHLVRTTNEVERAQLQALLGTLLGAAAMGAGAGDVGAAVMSGSQNIAMKNMYSFTRANEEAADQAALHYMDAIGISASGMLQMFEILRKQEYRKIGADSDPYIRTHPLSKERIMHIRNHVNQSPIASGTAPSHYTEMQDRLLGKLEGFLEDPSRVIQKYPLSDTSVKARYARAVAYHRLIEPDEAIAEMDALLTKNPDDPYFNELKGQILFESGRLEPAREAYSKAVQLMPDAPLIRTEYGRVLLASENKNDLPAAIRALEYASSADKKNPQAWRLLATAYGRDGRLALSHLALAEEAVLINKPDQAIGQLDIANNHILVGSPAQLRAQDLRRQALKLKKDKKKES
ncbi:MAG: M48 family metalloprotease [Alphaproteobacteria bacterium]|nr:M48 family metalloprotease [Alphaproteobacteria bacterium]